MPTPSHHTKTNSSHTRHAFTVLELSIVVTIVALLIASVLVGRDLLRNSEMMAVKEQIDEISSNMALFKQKYHALPGDMANAESFWGSDTTCPSTTATTTAHKQTCNGDGDGAIGIVYTASSSAMLPTAQTYEAFRAWQQMANASMINGTYSGTAKSGTSTSKHAEPGINVPAGRIKNTGLVPIYINSTAPTTALDAITFWSGNLGNAIIFGKATASSWTNAPALTPKEALLLDTKFDDGKPAYGTIRAKDTAPPSCTTTAIATTTAYNTTTTTEACSLVFMTGL